MKRLFTILAAVVLTASVFAQAPQLMSYQAVIRNSNNTLVANHAVGMRISILQGSAIGTSVYTETQTPTTNANGLVSIEIGSGVVVSGIFDSIKWANGPYFIKTETDPTGSSNYTITGTSQLLSVPYALYAGKSMTSTYSAGNGISITGNTITNTKPNQNQTLSLKGDTLSISNGNNVILPSNVNNLGSSNILKQITETGIQINGGVGCMTATTNGQVLIVAINSPYNPGYSIGILRMEKDQNGFYHTTDFLTLTNNTYFVNSMTIINNSIYFTWSTYASTTYGIKRVDLSNLGNLTDMTINPSISSASSLGIISTDGTNLLINGAGVSGSPWASYQIISTALISKNQNFAFIVTDGNVPGQTEILSVSVSFCIFDGVNYYADCTLGTYSSGTYFPSSYYIAKFDVNKNYISKTLYQNTSSIANSSANYLVTGSSYLGAIYSASNFVLPTPIIITTFMQKP